MSASILEYRATVEALLKLQNAVANEFPPDKYDGIAALVKDTQESLTELGLMIGGVWP
jgi:hypothetical protein